MMGAWILFIFNGDDTLGFTILDVISSLNL